MGSLITTSKMISLLRANPEFKRLGLKYLTLALIKQDRDAFARIWERMR